MSSLGVIQKHGLHLKLNGVIFSALEQLIVMGNFVKACDIIDRARKGSVGQAHKPESG